MPHRLQFTCQRTRATTVLSYSRADLAAMYSPADRALLAAGGALHIRWPGAQGGEHITIHDASVRLQPSHPEPNQPEARP